MQLRKEVYLVVALLMINSLVMPVLAPAISRSIQSYGTISYRLVFGVCGWDTVNSPSLTEHDFQEMQKLGVKWVRVDFSWSRIERSRGTFRWTEYDEYVQWGKKYDIKIIPLLCRIPTWLYSPGDINIPPIGPIFDDFVKSFGIFTYKVVERYREDITYLEIWNEPNIVSFWSDPDAVLEWDFLNRGAAIQKYVILLKEAYKQAKSANPNCVVIVGGLSGNDDKYLQGLYNYGAKDYFDMVGIHPYFYADCPTGLNYDPDYVDWGYWDPWQFPKIALMRNVMVANGDNTKSLVITELGIGNGTGPEGATTEEIQARALKRVFEKINRDPGYSYVAGVMWFHLRTNMENYGLLKEDYTPRQIYYAYQEVIAAYSLYS